ncbi:GPO family capsid scaffolding protein [Aeromonas caviae]|uniref:GPO family capsid scaffolding protein n=1 Tax=Aeromonas caviae TaxID=648 RepID=UPI001119E1BF|nr:GPO family capsid scaffolding protein [Aeromonas caviae]
MAKNAKFKRVAVSGQTTDGRNIAPEWLAQAAKNYNPEKYAARVNLEHIRSLHPDSAFCSYGDIRAVYAEEVDIEGEKKLALYAEIDPTDNLLSLNRARQKVFTSIELDLDFAGSGEAYLVGLALTDNPASLGTEMLKFSESAGTKSPFAARKHKEGNLYTCAIETEIEITEDAGKGPSLAERIAALFSTHKKQSTADFSDVHQAVETVAKEVTTLDVDLKKKFTEQDQTLTELTNKQDATAKALADLTAKLEGQEAFNQQRPPATGGDSASIQTDC